jgi:hypothetical protein
MKSEDGHSKFQDRIFREIQDRESIGRQNAVEQFVQIAATKGFTLDKLIEMAQSGISGSDLWSAVHSN